MDDYCGFVCSDIIDRQQKILDEITNFSEHNPEFAYIMHGRIMEMIYNSRSSLSNNKWRLEPPEPEPECADCNKEDEIWDSMVRPISTPDMWNSEEEALFNMKNMLAAADHEQAKRKRGNWGERDRPDGSWETE